jgi:uncharacterized protein YcnI
MLVAREESAMKRRWTARVLVGLATVTAIAAAGGYPASAHVTVHADDSTAGATDVQLTFRTPNELDNATTVKLQVFLPTDTPLLGVLVAPTPGWRSSTQTTKLTKSIQTDDGAVSEVTSAVTWSGGHIPVGGYLDFAISVGQLPDRAGDIVFKAVQTYSDGTVVRWVETSGAGAPEPEHPAPTLHLTAAGTSGQPTTPASAQPIAATSTSDGVSRGLAAAAIAVAVVALLTAYAAFRQRKRSRSDATD